MPRLYNATLNRADVSISNTLSPDDRALSVIFDNAGLINDASDAADRIESLSLELTIPYRAQEEGNLLVFQIRGALMVPDSSAWGAIVVMARGRRVVLHSADQPDVAMATLAVPVQGEGTLNVAAMLIGLRDSGDASSQVRVDLVGRRHD